MPPIPRFKSTQQAGIFNFWKKNKSGIQRLKEIDEEFNKKMEKLKKDYSIQSYLPFRQRVNTILNQCNEAFDAVYEDKEEK